MSLSLPEDTPEALAELGRERHARLADAFLEAGEAGALDRAAAEPGFARLLIASDFATDWLAAHPGALGVLLEGDRARRSPGRAGFAASLEAALSAEGEALSGERPDAREAALARAVRRTRNRELLGIIWRDVGAGAGFETTVADLSALAEVIIGGALERIESWAAEEAPLEPDGSPARLIVLGLGKLGGGELNLSYEVDLIFAYPDGPDAAARTRQQHFMRIARQLIAALDPRTVDGQAYRVDLRLRPFGESGPLVQSDTAMLGYYEEQGRDWERYAMIKARPVAGDRAAGEALLEGLRPFIYRRYLDFSAIDSLRRMKMLIRREVRRAGSEDDVKLGEGGIREVEFVAQAFQLIHGGRDVRLQHRSLLEVLARLEHTGALDAEAVGELRAAYVLLRDVEHGLQALRDRQTHRLPTDPMDRLRIAWGLGYPDWERLAEALGRQRRIVSDHFAEMIAEPEDAATEANAELGPWRRLWERTGGGEPDGEVRVWLERAGFEHAEEGLARLDDLRRARAEDVHQEVGRERLDALIPRLLHTAARLPQPGAAVLRTLPLIEAVLRRTAYLVLLVENPQALAQLLRLCAASAWIARTLARHPILLDELLDPRTLYTEPDRDALEQELGEAMRAADPEDLERQMEALRYFKEAVELRTAACEVTGVLPIMRVSDALTWLAEAVTARVVELAWQQIVARYGRPRGADGEALDREFLAVGYGKLGGLELGWGSDLDLVFLHDAPLAGETEGDAEGGHVVSNVQFFNRLGQRVIHLLSTRTHTGALYEVDVRLRPSGRSGMLVSSIDSFVDYHAGGAWTWEQQALVRARAVAGSERLRERFHALRAEVLRRERDRCALRAEVAAMRARMLAELRGIRERPEAESLQEDVRELDLKQDPGAVVDIEFMVQHLVLGWARAHPELVRYSDNIRILESARAVGILDASEADLLIDAYKAFRAEIHRQALENLPGRTDDPALRARAAAVAAVWERWMAA